MLMQHVLPGLSSSLAEFDLRPYQEECAGAIIYSYLHCDRNKGMIEVPTGGGKTRIALNVLHRLRTLDTSVTALIIQPTIDLAMKNWNEARLFFPPEEVGLVQAENRFYQHPIVVATTDTLANPLTRRKLLLAQGGKQFSFVWIDENHLKVMGVLPKILEDLEHPYALRLGVSATPKDSVLPVFPDGFFYQIGISKLVKEDYLLPFKVHVIATTEKNRPQAALDAWRDIVGRKPTIAFNKSVRQAHIFNEFFQANHVASAVISSEVKSREPIYKKFRRGIIPILNNWGVLTTGVDFPEACAAIIARDAWMKGTLSPVHKQAIGRIIRLCKGKEVGTIIYLTVPGADQVPDIQALSNMDELATIS